MQIRLYNYLLLLYLPIYIRLNYWFVNKRYFNLSFYIGTDLVAKVKTCGMMQYSGFRLEIFKLNNLIYLDNNIM